MPAIAADAASHAALDTENVVDDHLTGCLPAFVSQADAFFIMEGKHLPVHTAIVAANSPVLADMFASTHAKVSQCSKQTEGVSVPLPGETLLDIGRVLKFLYQRLIMPNAESPFKQLCSSPDDIYPILRFAHKWNMQVILDECDKSLAAAATAEPYAGGTLAKSPKTTETAGKRAIVNERLISKSFCLM